MRTLDEADGKPEGLTNLTARTRAIIAQKWTTLKVYFDYDDDYPHYVGLWTHTVWRKWVVVEFFTDICCKYHAEVVKARKEGVELVTSGVDCEYLGLAECILQLGRGGEKVIAIKDWERPGTKLTMDGKVLVVEDLEEDDHDDDQEEEEEETAQDRLECTKMDVDGETGVSPLVRAKVGGPANPNISLPLRHR